MKGSNRTRQRHAAPRAYPLLAAVLTAVLHGCGAQPPASSPGAQSVGGATAPEAAAHPAAAQERVREGVAGGAGQTATPATARDSVIAVVQEFFRAMAANDVEASRRVLLPEGVRFSILQTPEGPRLRRQANEAYFAWLAQNDDALFEHIREMTAHVQGAIAMVWAPYDFYVNGEFSHCGTNAISLLRTREGWQIASSAWTIEPEGCEPSPPGTPQEE